jgi:hypothetical protein
VDRKGHIAMDLKAAFEEFRRHDRRLDYANGCRCKECIEVKVEDEEDEEDEVTKCQKT